MWLEQSATSQATWEPIAFELAFGLPRDPGNDPGSVETEVTLAEGYRLRGIVESRDVRAVTFWPGSSLRPCRRLRQPRL